jgi:presenilin-like A22 family membrane protease
MSKYIRIYAPALIMLVFLVATQFLALAITPVIRAAADIGRFPLPFSPDNQASGTIGFVIVILAITALLILAIRSKHAWLINGIIFVSMAISIDYVLMAFLSWYYALVSTFMILVLLRIYSVWYVVDIFCIMICAGFSSIYGISLRPHIELAILLLIVLAVYDVISVYKTRHMVFLAEAMIRIKAPLIFVLPKYGSYSFNKDRGPIPTNGSKISRPFFLGLGDVIIPTILVISAYLQPINSGLSITALPVLGAMLGTYLGFIILMTTLSDRMHAGLPFLNGGAILGFFLGCILSGSVPSCFV